VTVRVPREAKRGAGGRERTDVTSAHRENERARAKECAKVHREMERYRASAAKAERELVMVKRLREVERGEARATRAALMESNRDAKMVEAERMREIEKYESAWRRERALREAAERGRDELTEMLREACAKLDEADANFHKINRKIEDDMQKTVDEMEASRVNDLERIVSSVGATQVLLNRLSHIYEGQCARSREALVNLELRADALR